jgi:hypothetical protein
MYVPKPELGNEKNEIAAIVPHEEIVPRLRTAVRHGVS